MVCKKKHLVYAEDILYELMQHKDNSIYKYEFRQLIENVVKEKEVYISTPSTPVCGAGVDDCNEDGYIYD